VADPLSDVDVRACGGQWSEHAGGRRDDNSLVDVDRLTVRWCGEDPAGVRIVIAQCAPRQAVMTGSIGVGDLAAEFADRPHHVAGDPPSALARGPLIARWIDR
jgi:hypothetical protein